MQGPLTVQCTVIYVIPNDKIYELPKSWLYCIGIQDLTRIVFAIKSRDNDVAIFFFYIEQLQSQPMIRFYKQITGVFVV